MLVAQVGARCASTFTGTTDTRWQARRPFDNFLTSSPEGNLQLWIACAISLGGTDARNADGFEVTADAGIRVPSLNYSRWSYGSQRGLQRARLLEGTAIRATPIAS